MMKFLISKISVKIADNLVESQHVQGSEREVYIYGLETFMVHFINFLSTLVLALFMRQAWEYLVFSFLFMPLRSNAGGYHASSPLRCYLLSTGITVAALLLVRYLPVLNHAWGIFLLLAAALVVLMLVPVGTPNKPLDPEEKKVYGYRARIILAIEVCLCVLCFVFSWFTVFWLIVLVISTVALSLIAGLFVEKNLMCGTV